MPFPQLRALVIALIAEAEAEEAAREFDMQPTTYRPPPRRGPPKSPTRFPTLDTVLAELLADR